MEDVGLFLREERNRQQLSLEEVSRRTCVSLRMLRALEEGRYEDVGTPLLIRGFIRSYCGVLDIDPEPILERYSNEIRGFDRHKENLRRYGSWMHEGDGKRRYLFYTFFGLLLVGMVFGFNLWLTSHKADQSRVGQAPESLIYPQKDFPQDLPTKEIPANKPVAPSGGDEQVKPVPPSPRNALDGEPGPSSSPVQQQASVPEQPAATAASSASSPESPPSPVVPVAAGEGTPVVPSASATSAAKTHHVLRLKALEETWLQVQLENGKKENRLMKAGETRAWEVEKSIRLWLGNAGGVKASWDGKPLSPFGKRGRVIRVRLPDPKYLVKP